MLQGMPFDFQDIHEILTGDRPKFVDLAWTPLGDGHGKHARDVPRYKVVASGVYCGDAMLITMECETGDFHLLVFFRGAGYVDLLLVGVASILSVGLQSHLEALHYVIVRNSWQIVQLRLYRNKVFSGRPVHGLQMCGEWPCHDLQLLGARVAPQYRNP